MVDGESKLHVANNDWAECFRFCLMPLQQEDTQPGMIGTDRHYDRQKPSLFYINHKCIAENESKLRVANNDCVEYFRFCLMLLQRKDTQLISIRYDRH